MLYGEWKPGKSVITCYRKAAGYRSDGALFSKIATKDGDPFRERWQAMGGNPADAEAAREEILTRFIIEELQHCAFEAAAVLGLWMPGHPMPLSNHRPLRERAAAGRWFDRPLERDFRCLTGVHPRQDATRVRQKIVSDGLSFWIYKTVLCHGLEPNETMGLRNDCHRLRAGEHDRPRPLNPGSGVEGGWVRDDPSREAEPRLRQKAGTSYARCWTSFDGATC